MNIKILEIKDQGTYKDLYELLSHSDNYIGLFSKISESEFESILINGFTYGAYVNNELSGFINFEVLLEEGSPYCLQNIIFSKKCDYSDDIYSTLFDTELSYINRIDNIKFIRTHLFIDDKETSYILVNKGFKKTKTQEMLYNNISYCSVFYDLLLNIETKHTKEPSISFKDRIKRFVFQDKKGNLNILNKSCHFFKISFLILKINLYRHILLTKIKHKNKVKVIFVASSISMWKYQELYDLMIKDKRFEISIVLSPFTNFSSDLQKNEIQMLKEYFISHNMKYYDFMYEGKVFDIKCKLTPDLLFYPQPYTFCYCKEHNPLNFANKLIAYIPYAFYIEKDNMFYNGFFQEIAWKLFYPNAEQKNLAKRYAVNKGNNVSVVGYSLAEQLISPPKKDVWKTQQPIKKRIIWAPHFSINSNTSITNHSNFLLIADFMLDLAIKYKDKIQFAFKPHPRLKKELYNNIKWGKDKTDIYYSKWESLENGQLETGDFVDLFLTSDAMIHDSASFCIDYLYTKKPVMFISNNINSYKDTLTNFANEALDMHYVGGSKADIEYFVNEVVINGNDVLKTNRSNFYESKLLTLNSTTTAEKTYNVIVQTLFNE